MHLTVLGVGDDELSVFEKIELFQTTKACFLLKAFVKLPFGYFPILRSETNGSSLTITQVFKFCQSSSYPPQQAFQRTFLLIGRAKIETQANNFEKERKTRKPCRLANGFVQIPIFAFFQVFNLAVKCFKTHTKCNTESFGVHTWLMGDPFTDTY